MRPPICAICHKSFSSRGGLVHFSLTEQEKEYNKSFEQPGFVGHPAGLEWFCEEHLPEAKLRSNLTKAQAIRELQQIFLKK
ncbi:MAG: hypothetical protein JXR68_04540 [Bacteroidales bacterium]|nr:hypothetical protein [Bacteroidales bacterium]